MLRVKNVQKSYGTLAVLSGVSFSLGRGQKAALVGHNGTGKTTLLRIVAGLEESDGGSVEITKGMKIGYLPQDTSLVGNETVSEYLRKVSGVDRIEQELETLSDCLSDSTNVERYDELQEEYKRVGGYEFSNRMQVILSGFGLDQTALNKSLEHLSSGQKSKVSLAGILLAHVDLLLLDEPTNNLDLPALIWLEDFLRTSDAASIIVSHDRRFLDKVVRRIFELDWHSHTLSSTAGTYSGYIERAMKKLEKSKQEYALQREEIERLTKRAQEQKTAAAKGAKWKGSDNDKMLRGFKRDQAGRSSRVAKTIEKRIEHMDKLERPQERDPFAIQLDAEKLHGGLNINLIDLVAGYPNGFKIGPLSLSVRYGERVGILGLNGTGKSTLLKTLTGEMVSMQGTISIGSGLRIGNLMQEHESLPRDASLIELVMSKSNLDEEHSFNQLVKFGFDRVQVRREIGTLSPGGRARLLLALFAAMSVNALILDEPTNHLDIEALDALEETLKDYKGTVILVSHDRYFTERASLDTVYVLSEGFLTKIPDYKTYVASAEERAQKLLKLL